MQINTEKAHKSGDIDWTSLWQQQRNAGRKAPHDCSFWNRRAASFASNARKSMYADQFISLLAPQPGWTILDVGCGAGTLALPLSQQVARVTAIDFSDTMIAILQGECEVNNIDNVDARVVSWEDDWDKAGIGVHDIAIASRSLLVEQPQEAIKKLTQRARERIMVTAPVGDGPFDRKIFEAIGRELKRGPDYIHLYNILYQMGIQAEVTFIEDSDRQKTYSDIDAAIDGYRWMIDDLSENEISRLRKYLQDNMIRCEDGFHLSYRLDVRWAVLSWKR